MYTLENTYHISQLKSILSRKMVIISSSKIIGWLVRLSLRVSDALHKTIWQVEVREFEDLSKSSKV